MSLTFNITMRVQKADFTKAAAKSDLISQAVRSSLVLAAMRDANPLVPMLTGALRMSAESQSKPNEGQLIYGSAAVPYARPHYFAPGGWHYTMPGTGPAWFDKAKQTHLPLWIREAEMAGKEAASR